jgi:Reversibly glycosylated polypeptide
VTASAPPRVDVVMTTIGDGSAFLDAYRELLDRTGARDRVRLVVIPDRRTPARLFDACADARRAGFDVLCPMVPEQDRLLAGLGVPTLVPYDSDNRRNVGYLLSWSSDADLLVSVDDDNFPVGADFLDVHRTVCAGPRPARVVHSPSGWWNPCAQLATVPTPIYPRGFPYAQRAGRADGDGPADPTESTELVDVRVNAGLWLGDPDVDAITRIAMAPEVHDLTRPEAVLGATTWAPVNSQNTAVERGAVPAYYFPRMGYRHQGQRIDRYADIFSGYFVQACAKHLGHAVRFGTPLARHTRNAHQLFTDLGQELPALMILEDLVQWLRGCRLEGDSYPAAYLSLSHQLQDAVEEMSGGPWTPELRGFVHQMAQLMRQWLRALARVAGEPVPAR